MHIAVPSNWKSNLSAVAIALASFVLANPDFFSRWPWVKAVAAFVLSGGLAAFGISKNAESAAAHQVALDMSQETRDTAADTHAKMDALEKNTNSKMDALLKVTGQSEYARGVKQGQEEGKT